MLVGIDIGGTKTQMMAANGLAVSDISMPTSEWRARENAEADAATLVAALTKVTGGKLPGVLVAGSHGCDTDEECGAFQQRLAQLLPATVVLVLNDSELLLPAAGKDVGISVICGTGSIAVARSDDRRMIAAGGWGWYLGDEGSAAGLVREAARTVRRSLDSGEPLEPLGRSLLQALGIDNPVELGRALGDQGSAARIGSFVPLVFAAADAGSALALDVIAQGGKALAALVSRLIDRGAPGNDIVTGGGVITRQPRLFEAFQSALATVAPDWRLTLLREPPVIGAMALARQLQAGERPAYLPFPHIAGTISNEDDWRAA